MSIISTALQRIPDASLFDRGWRFLLDQLMQEVPAGLAVCEFDCRETDCTMERYVSCERRLQAGRPAAVPSKQAA